MIVIDKKTLSKSYQASLKIMEERATSFYHAFKNLPKERFMGVAALYAFNRYADDLVDWNQEPSAMKVALDKLKVLEDNIKRIPTVKDMNEFDETLISLDWWSAFYTTIMIYRIEISHCLSQIDGQRTDAEFKPLKDIEDLIQYSQKVAGSVGLMLLPILTVDPLRLKNPLFQKAAEDLGVGMQITNILRDVGEDIKTRNRIYLPEEILAQYKVNMNEIEKIVLENESDPEIPTEFIKAWDFLFDLANHYYEAYLNYLEDFHPKVRLPLIAAAKMYQAIGEVVKEEGHNCLTKRCYTSKERRIDILKLIQRNYHL